MHDRTDTPVTAGTRDDMLDRIGQTMARLRIMIGRRVVVRKALANVAPQIELSAIDVIDVIRRMDPGQEATIGAISEALRIDPSRGSRIVADMVAQGVVQRQASQEDGRRSIVVMTAFGQRIIEEIHTVKQQTIAEITSDWSEEDVANFARLYDRFVEEFAARLSPCGNTPGRR